MLRQTPLRIIGVVKAQEQGMGASQNLEVYLPYTTVQTRMTGTNTLQSIIVRVADTMDPTAAEKIITSFSVSGTGRRIFSSSIPAACRRPLKQPPQHWRCSSQASLAFLFVGGIGVMNIMLVSVSERVNEIGVRMAVGARQSDILQQFLIESVLVCLIGGLAGTGFALGFGVLFAQFNSMFALIYSPGSILVAILCSSLIGVGFGFIPARNASRLDPVVALARN